MRKSLKKGFTIVELVIVIAVIAVLAGVLVPVFSGVINNANKSAAMQEMGNEWTAYLVEKSSSVSPSNSYIAVYNKPGTSDYYAMAILKTVKETDYVGDKANSEAGAIQNLNKKLSKDGAASGQTVNGITFKCTTTASSNNMIVKASSSTADITSGVNGCGDTVKIYAAAIKAGLEKTVTNA